MGTICILFGCIVFLGSIFLGFFVGDWAVSTFANSFRALVPTDLYITCVGICAFIGLLIFLNLLMHGLTYNKVCKLGAENKIKD